MVGPLAILSVLLLPLSLSFSSAASEDTALSDCLTPEASVRSPNPEPDPVAVKASGLSLSAGL